MLFIGELNGMDAIFPWDQNQITISMWRSPLVHSKNVCFGSVNRRQGISIRHSTQRMCFWWSNNKLIVNYNSIVNIERSRRILINFAHRNKFIVIRWIKNRLIILYCTFSPLETNNWTELHWICAKKWIN